MTKPHPLSGFVPEKAIGYIESLLGNTRITITITGQRVSRHGSFSEKNKEGRYHIRVARCGNPYAFLLTMVHEIAHLKVFQKYGRKALPHGREWKNQFQMLMMPLLEDNIFPEDLKKVLMRHMQNPTASSSTDPELVKALADYNEGNEEGLIYIDELERGESFVFRNRIFIRMETVRKRIKCRDQRSGRLYLFSPVAKVKPLRS